MSARRFHFHQLETQHPASREPAWSSLVERWYQLDGAAFGLCALYTEMGLSQYSRPEMIFLSSPGGCNTTDAQFARQGASSPAKFVHTLPNIRGSVLLQVMNWSGPLLCFQNDPVTLVTAVVQTTSFEKSVWIFGQSENRFNFCLRSADDGAFQLQRIERVGESLVDDRALLEWFGNPGRPVAMGEGWQLAAVDL